MPLDVCHPHTPHKKLRIPEWFISDLMMDRALDAIVRRAKTIDPRHDIPYLARYRRHGQIIYIDPDMPPTMRDGRRPNDHHPALPPPPGGVKKPNRQPWPDYSPRP